MNITREDMPGRQVALTIELETEQVNEALDKAYRQIVNQVNVPGFRRGKAPRSILESYVGRDMLTERAVNNILPQTVQDAIREQKIEAMDIGEVDIVSMDPVQVKVIIVQPPRIELGEYGDVRVEKEQTEVTDEQVEEVLLELRREGAPWNEPVEPRPIREGDMVYLNLEGFTTAGELPEAKREEFPTLVGMERGSGVPEVVNKALEGMAIGDEKDIADTLPDDYPNEELRDKDVTYHVTALSMKEQQLPELDDEFARGLGAYETVDALRQAVKENLQQRTQEAAESNQIESAIGQLVGRSSVEVPEMMVKEEVDGMLKRLENRLKEQRLTLRQYFTYSGTTEQEWREANRPRAEERLTRMLVLQEFARREGIQIEEEEIDREIETILERFEGDERERAQSVLGSPETKDEIENRIFQRKLLDQLVGIAEGRIEAAAVGTTDDGRQTAEAGDDEGRTAEDETPAMSNAPADGEADVTALEEAGGAAEVLGTEGLDVKSPYETGEAAGGGTPEGAPRLEDEEKS